MFDVLLDIWERLPDASRDLWHKSWADMFGFSPSLFRARVYWLQATGRLRTREQYRRRLHDIEISTRRLNALHVVATRCGLADAITTLGENRVERQVALLRVAETKRGMGKPWQQIAHEIGYSRNYLWRLRRMYRPTAHPGADVREGHER